jgi:hypothetical protein
MLTHILRVKEDVKKGSRRYKIGSCQGKRSAIHTGAVEIKHMQSFLALRIKMWS